MSCLVPILKNTLKCQIVTIYLTDCYYVLYLYMYLTIIKIILTMARKKDNTPYLIGALVGVFLGAFLPDEYNPITLIKKVTEKKK